MLINMCNPRLQPGITCNKPSCDGYEVENLVKMGNNGFMVEPFIKAPVCITLQFPCNVHIFKICINPFVGSQKSLGFEIFTNSENVKQSWLTNSSNCTIPVDTDGHFVPVGKTLMTEASNLCFQNNKFDCRERTLDQCPSTIPCKKQVPLSHKLAKSLQHVSHVLVRITRTAGSCVPCIGRLEVWAKPSASVPKELKKKIYSIFSNLQTLESQPNSVSIEENQIVSRDDGVTGSLTDNPVSCVDSINVPDEFVDPLTCEIMSVPMLLPSGQSVDQKSLENFISAEANWGRPPSNPFTGIRFSKTYKAVPNLSLKVRIDKFLMENGSHFPNIARTVGRASDFHNQHIPVTASKWAALSQNAFSRSIPLMSNKSTTKSNPKFNESTSQKINKTKPKDYKDDNSSTSQKSNLFNPMKPEHCISSRCFSLKRNLDSESDQQSSNKKINLANETTNASSHENSLTQSLNNALSQALSNLPTYLNSKKKPSDEKQGQITPGKCDKCDFSGIVSLYLLPCKHVVCSPCLKSLRSSVQIPSEQYICSLCKKSFNAKDVCRLYV